MYNEEICLSLESSLRHSVWIVLDVYWRSNDYSNSFICFGFISIFTFPFHLLFLRYVQSRDLFVPSRGSVGLVLDVYWRSNDYNNSSICSGFISVFTFNCPCLLSTLLNEQ